jgi:hypothetical protein
MLNVLILAIVALAIGLFAAFIALCLAIRREDRSPRLNPQAPSVGTAATRRVAGLCVRRPAPPSEATAPSPSVALWDAPYPPESGPEGGNPLNAIPDDVPERHCPCGALLEKGTKRCRKCRARSRWYRRRSGRRRPASTRRHRAGTAPRGR